MRSVAWITKGDPKRESAFVSGQFPHIHSESPQQTFTFLFIISSAIITVFLLLLITTTNAYNFIQLYIWMLETNMITIYYISFIYYNLMYVWIFCVQQNICNLNRMRTWGQTHRYSCRVFRSAFWIRVRLDSPTHEHGPFNTSRHDRLSVPIQKLFLNSYSVFIHKC